MTEIKRSPESETNHPLSYEQFSQWRKSKYSPKGKPPHNNFYLHFIDEEGNAYREVYGKFDKHSKLLQKLRDENPELEKQLTEALTTAYKERNIMATLRQLEPLLYQAYLIMRKYTEDDEDLFR